MINSNQKKVGTLSIFAMLCVLLIASTGSIDTRPDSPVKIFYGLNESHSTSWARCTEDGMAAVVYFQPDETYSGRRPTQRTEGSLYYRTILSINSENEELVASGTNMEVSVLLLDSDDNPHIFVAKSNETDQTIDYYYKNEFDEWVFQTIMHFNNEGGEFIYEMSAALGPENTYHLSVLKTYANPDSEEYYYAFLDAHLFYVTNITGNWERELIHSYDTLYTLDEYSKASVRQDIDVDQNGFAHIIFGEQINGLSNFSPSRLCYTTNMSGNWDIETAVNYTPNTRDSAGWYPSLTLKNNGEPAISCCYVGRVPTGSAAYARLLYVEKIEENSWESEIVAQEDDGYYGFDGGEYTGGITHLVFDENDTPHIVFSDIASSHERSNYFNLGNIRYAVKEESNWELSTIYHQELPVSFFTMLQRCMECVFLYPMM